MYVAPSENTNHQPPLLSVEHPMFSAALWESIQQAFASLSANKLRTLLTLIGIVVGVTAVIAVVTVIEGLNQKVAQTFASQGSNVFSVRKNI